MTALPSVASRGSMPRNLIQAISVNWSVESVDVVLPSGSAKLLSLTDRLGQVLPGQANSVSMRSSHWISGYTEPPLAPRLSRYDAQVSSSLKRAIPDADYDEVRP